MNAIVKYLKLLKVQLQDLKEIRSFCLLQGAYKKRRIWSAIVVAIIASPTGTALMPTQGSCLPLVIIEVCFLLASIVCLFLRIELVGLTANLTIATDENALMIGPIDLANNVSITVQGNLSVV